MWHRSVIQIVHVLGLSNRNIKIKQGNNICILNTCMFSQISLSKLSLQCLWKNAVLRIHDPLKTDTPSSNSMAQQRAFILQKSSMNALPFIRMEDRVWALQPVRGGVDDSYLSFSYYFVLSPGVWAPLCLVKAMENFGDFPELLLINKYTWLWLGGGAAPDSSWLAAHEGVPGIDLLYPSSVLGNIDSGVVSKLSV